MEVEIEKQNEEKKNIEERLKRKLAEKEKLQAQQK